MSFWNEFTICLLFMQPEFLAGSDGHGTEIGEEALPDCVSLFTDASNGAALAI